MALIVWRVQDSVGTPIARALVQGDGDTLGHWQGLTNACGDFIAELGADHYQIRVSHLAYETRTLPADLADCGIITVGLDPAPVVIPTIRPVHPSGPGWLDDRGEAWRWQLVTAFKAAQRWCAGEDLSGFLAWTRQVGANGWRVFCQHAYLDSHEPDWPACPWVLPLEKARPFVEWCAKQGLYVEMTLLCDCQVINPSEDEQVERVKALLFELDGAENVFAEMCNEPHENGCDPVKIAEALDLFTTRPFPMALGLYPETGHEPNFPSLDYIGDHPPRKDTWPIECGKTGHYQYEQTGAVCLSDEPPKFAEESGPGSDPESTECSWETSPNNAEDAGGGFGIGCAGATFHCRSGIDTVVPGALQTACAERFFTAMASFPADAVYGIYSHDGAPGHPLKAINDESIVGEVASRIKNTVSYAAAAQPTSAWVPMAHEGWTLAERWGTRGTLMRLTR